jgi:kynurenine formamidase
LKIVDLTHPWSIHTPGWVGYPGGKLYYTQNLQTDQIVSQRLEVSLHSGTHLDGPMHGTDTMEGMADLPLTKLVHEGVIVDVSDVCGDWDLITPEHITSKVDVKPGDIIIIHTGWHRYYQGQPEQDLVRYFCMHPGGGIELARWMGELGVRWWGIDAGSGDHPMNTTIRDKRPDLAARFEDHIGMPISKFFGEYEYIHHKSGRQVTSEIFPMHHLAFQEGCIHAENLGGDIAEVLNTRCIIGFFPLKIEGGEAAPGRCMAFLDCGTEVIDLVAERAGSAG